MLVIRTSLTIRLQVPVRDTVAKDGGGVLEE